MQNGSKIVKIENFEQLKHLIFFVSKFWTQISSILFSRAPFSDPNPLKYVAISSEQIYLPMRIHFCVQWRLPGEILGDSSNTGPK